MFLGLVLGARSTAVLLMCLGQSVVPVARSLAVWSRSSVEFRLRFSAARSARSVRRFGSKAVRGGLVFVTRKPRGSLAARELDPKIENSGRRMRVDNKIEVFDYLGSGLGKIEFEELLLAGGERGITRERERGTRLERGGLRGGVAVGREREVGVGRLGGVEVSLKGLGGGDLLFVFRLTKYETESEHMPREAQRPPEVCVIPF